MARKIGLEWYGWRKWALREVAIEGAGKIRRRC